MAKKKQIELTIEEKLQNALVPKEEQPYKIPSNWCWLYSNFVVNVRDGTHDTPKYISEGYPLITSKNLKNNNIDFDKVNYISKEDYEKINLRSKVDIGDVLFSMIGTIGNPVLIKGQTNYAIKNVALFKDINLINMTFFRFYLETKFVIDKMKKEAKGSTQKFVSLKYLRNFPICYPSLEEQQRIVNRIESLFTKLDRAKELIENTLAQFEQNKMAILHKAFSGELTAKWREENNIDLSSWQNQSINEVCEINPKKVDTKKLDDNLSVSFIPMPCVSDILGKITSMEIRNLVEVKKGYTNFSEGDILFAKITPCMENGKSAIVGKLENDIGFGSTEFHVLRCDTDKINNKFLHYFVRQRKFRDEAKVQMTGAVGQQRVPKIFIEDYKINLPIIEEQQAIVNILDKVFIKYDKIRDLQVQIDKIELLKKSILAKAFRGELGTNDPNEESAELLLREILAEK